MLRAPSKTPVGVEPTSNRFAGGCRAVWLRRQLLSVLARNRTWPSTFAGSRALLHTPRTCRGLARKRGLTPYRMCKPAFEPQTGSGLSPFMAQANTPPRSRTSSDSFEGCHASSTPAGRRSPTHSRTKRTEAPNGLRRRLTGQYRLKSRPGVEPGPGPSDSPMRSVTPSGRPCPKKGD